VKYISVSFDITEHVELVGQLEWQASHDWLTGLPNRAFLLKHLEKKMLPTDRLLQRPFALGMLDMNGFKLVNDTYGHSIGDRLLIETARRLRANFRQEDVVARLGGDEFVIV
jgi:diguanylate cyclase (GGDEF)-like protein